MHAPPDGEAIVSVDALTKRFAVRRTWREILSGQWRSTTTTAVDAVTFSVRPGEIFGLLGPNGAGKTTIFKMLTTLILPDSGSARVHGHDIVAEPSGVRRMLAPVIANERSLNWRLSARENVRLYTALQGLRGQAARTEEDRVLAVVGLQDAGTKPVNEYSSGMRQRLLLARALIGTPSVLLLDEPTRSLDPISARDFRAFLRDVVIGEQRCTVLLATHDADEVWDLCDRVGVLARGRLLEVGTTQALRYRYGHDRFRAWIDVAHAGQAAERARAAGFSLARRGEAREAGWEELEFEVPGGLDDSARLLAVINDGARVSQFERVAPSLAELIERVIAPHAGGPPHA